MEHTVATSVLAHYAADKPRLLVSLLLDAEPKSFSILFPVVEANRSDVYSDLLEAVTPGRRLLPGRIRRGPTVSPRTTAPAPPKRAKRLEIGRPRAARAAVALVRLGDRDKVRHLLEHGPDSRRRSAFINALAPFGTESAILVDELDRLADAGRTDADKGRSGRAKNSYLFDSVVSMRCATLIQALAGYPKQALDPGGSDALIKTLTDLYLNDLDAGVHSSAELLLRRWGYGDRLKTPTAWPAGPIERRWYVNREGQTMVFIDGPLVYDMGTSKSDPGLSGGRTPASPRNPEAVLHRLDRGQQRGVQEICYFRIHRRSQVQDAPKSRSGRSDDQGELVRCRCLLQLAESTRRPASVL